MRGFWTKQSQAARGRLADGVNTTICARRAVSTAEWDHLGRTAEARLLPTVSDLAGSPFGGAFARAERPADSVCGPAPPPSPWRSSPAAPRPPPMTGRAEAETASASD